MNILGLVADAVHICSFLILLFKLWINKSSAGVSGKTQLILVLVFTIRYLDLFTVFYSHYNTSMKIILLCLSYATVGSIYLKFRKSYEEDVDTFRLEFIVAQIAICVFLAPILNPNLDFLGLTWTCSRYLEAVAAWPQFFMIYKTKKVLTSVFLYLSALGWYRVFYISKWIYWYFDENYLDLNCVVPGCVELIPFLIFWGCCATKVVVITSKERWFRKNLQHNLDQNGVFTIKVQEQSNEKGEDKLNLLPSSEEMANAEPINTIQNV